MSSILRTIDCNQTIRVGDYVKFNGDKLGYVKEIINTVSVRVTEAGTSERPRHYTVRKKMCKLVPLAGIDPAKNRTILQPPSPKLNKDEQVI